MAKLTAVNLGSTSLTHQQVVELFPAICSSSSLVAASFYGINLTMLNASTLASTITKMEEADLFHTHLTPLQIQHLFSAMVEPSSKLKSLELAEGALASVDPCTCTLATALSRLEFLALWDGGVRVTTQQLEQLFTAMGQGSCLKSMDLSSMDLSGVDPATLATGISASGLEEVDLSYTNLTLAQLECLFTTLTSGPTSLHTLLLYGVELGILQPPATIRYQGELRY